MSSMPPIFTLNPEEYTRKLDIVENYILQGADMLSRLYGDPIEKTRKFVRDNMSPTGLFPLQDPAVTYLAKESRGNREYYNGIIPEGQLLDYSRYDGTFLKYLKRVTDNGLLLAPTLTVYLKPTMKKSVMAEYIGQNLKLRKTYKHKMFDLELVGDNDGAAFYNILQTTCKIKNNSVSGAHSSPSTVLYVKSAHPTLTSTCRISTSYGNANNEKFQQGNRHYWCPDVVISNIFAIIQNTDYEALSLAVHKYKIVLPSANDMMECILYSTVHYWKNKEIESRIYKICESLTDLERAAFMYTGDLYHLAKLNPELVRSLILELSQVNHTEKVEDPAKVLKELDDYTTSFVNALCFEFMMGKPHKDLPTKYPEDHNKLAATALHVNRTLEKYRELVAGLWKPALLAPSIAVLPSIVRRAVVTSDTDSSIFTNQYWVEFIFGKLEFHADAFRVGNTTTYLTAQLVRHTLALMSANLGIDSSQIHQISMKNEYYFNEFFLTSSAKHYFAEQNSREGGVFKVPKLEIKGVELRSSNAPESVMNEVKEYAKYIMRFAMSGGKMTYKDVFEPIYKIEKDILDDIRQGGYRYLRSMQIRDKDSYVNAEDSSAYQQHLLWSEVFAPKYGYPEELPYRVAKVSLTVNNKTRLYEWILSIKDEGIRKRMLDWVAKNGKTSLTTIMLPEAIIAVHGVPEEILQVANIRKLIFGIVSPFYLILESLGVYMKDKAISRLVVDFYEELVTDRNLNDIITQTQPPKSHVNIQDLAIPDKGVEDFDNDIAKREGDMLTKMLMALSGEDVDLDD